MAERSPVRTDPCGTCPFRGDFHLRRGRRLEIHHALTVDDLTFHCHSEVDYDADGEPDTGGARQCAGAVILMAREGQANQHTRVVGRLGLLPPLEEIALNEAVPFESWEQWINEDESPARGL